MGLQSSTQVSFLYVADRDRALDFYCQVLGLTLQSSDAFGDFIDTGRGLIRMTVMPNRSASDHPVLGWEVKNIQAAVRDLGERGVEFSIFDGMGQDEHGIWTSPDNGNQVAWFSDPEGNVLSLSSTSN